MNEILNKEVKFIHLGKVDYQKAWDYQDAKFKEVIDKKIKIRHKIDENDKKISNFLIFCQHPPVITLGKSGNEAHLLLDQKALRENGVSFIRTNRGGDITFHGPGQLVGYPILDLENFFTDIHRYLRDLEEVVIRTLSDFGITAERVKDLTGVWITHNNRPRKICALGVRTSRWVTMHGFALNVSTDLSYFDYIIPCGISDKTVTSMEKELGMPIAMQEVEQKIKFHFEKIFKMKLID